MNPLYRATAERSEGWWAIGTAVSGDRTVWTQSRRLDLAQEVAAESVSMALDIPIADISVRVEPVLSPDLAAEIRNVHELGADAARAQEAHAKANRALATRLVDEGYSVRDAGVLMQISAQRVSQLVAEARKDAPMPATESYSGEFYDVRTKTKRTFKGVRSEAPGALTPLK